MKYIIICGPTCSGKTGLGVELALRYNGEVINADSRQIYKHTSIGTAKPKAEECRGINHHLIGFLELHEKFSAYKFAELSKGLIEDITARGKLPLIVGGTGLYLRALTEGLFKSPQPDYEYRKKLELINNKDGPDVLHTMLAEIDPEAAKNIKRQDIARIIRALEIHKLTDKPISEMQKTGEYYPVGNPIWLGLMPERKILYNRINKRVDDMINEGFEQEVLRLRPYLEDVRKKKMVGYIDMISCLIDKITSRQEAIEKVKQHHRNYAKRQITWFRKVNDICWLNPDHDGFADKAFNICDRYLKKA